jgi:Glyoxalase-like domain
VSLRIDHLVVVADTLAQGAAWCEATFGVAPGAGGQHPLFGTHNRLLTVGSAAFPDSYFEIIAVDPQAAPPQRVRWFGMDDPALRAAVRQAPQCVQAVVRCDDLQPARQRLHAAGLDGGRPIAASRQTPAGLLAWQINLRDDGRLESEGACPTLIQWGAVHPAASLPASLLQLTRVQWGGPACAPLRIENVEVRARPGWAFTFASPRGEVTLSSFFNWSRPQDD